MGGIINSKADTCATHHPTRIVTGINKVIIKPITNNSNKTSFSNHMGTFLDCTTKSNNLAGSATSSAWKNTRLLLKRHNTSPITYNFAGADNLSTKPWPTAHWEDLIVFRWKDNWQRQLSGWLWKNKNTPLLGDSTIILHVCFFTPSFCCYRLQLINDFQNSHSEYMLILVTVIISFVFSIISKVGEVNEDPFENRNYRRTFNCALQYHRTRPERNVGCKNPPDKKQPEDGFLF